MKEQNKFDLETHFQGKDKIVRDTYDELMKILTTQCHVVENPRKTSIHLLNGTTLAGVSTRKSYLILTIKSDCIPASPRIRRSEQVSRDRFHLKLKLNSPADVNQELIAWLNKACALSAPGKVNEKS
jgi:hypothetical protein